MADAANKNVLLWVLPDCFSKLIFVVHTADVKINTFGPLTNRRDTFHIGKKALFNPCGEHNISPVEVSDYHTFGQNSKATSYSERILRGLQAETIKNDKLLSNSAKIGTRSQCVTNLMGIEMFSYLKDHLLYNNSFEEEVLHHRKSGPKEKEVRRIVRPNLEIYAHTVSRKHDSLIAKTMPQFQHCQHVISSIQGVGIRERMPSKKLVEEAGGVIRRPLVEGDTVNSVFIDPCCDDAEGTEFPTDVTETTGKRQKPTQQYMKWAFDHSNHHCKTSIKCLPIIAGSNSLAVRSFLSEREIEWANDGDSPNEVDIGFGDFILYPDGEYWKVSHVNVELAQVHLLSCSGGESDIRNLDWCLENKV